MGILELLNLKCIRIFPFQKCIPVEVKNCSVVSGPSNINAHFSVCEGNVPIIRENRFNENQTVNEHISILFDTFIGRKKNVYLKLNIGIFNCTNYNRCQNQNVTLDKHLQNSHVSVLCSREGNSTNKSLLCSEHTYETKVLPEKIECQYTVQFKCLKYSDGCFSNLHHEHCESFICPIHFFKCPNAYSILLESINNGIHDCPFGEDERVFKQFDCFDNLTYMLNEICIKRELMIEINVHFICSTPCPIGYRCLSNWVHHSEMKPSLLYYSIHVPLYTYAKSFLPFNIFAAVPSLSLVEFYGSKCNIQIFDTAFQFLRLSELIVLDLSHNDLASSDDMKYFEKLVNLKMLNLSYNENLEIKNGFQFTTLLETIDLSHTHVDYLAKNMFQKLTNLRYLDISYTRITRFEHMGIPDYFTLDTLNLQGVHISNIIADFFRGLTIKSSISVSDYKLCCPNILNINISVDKCLGPTDAISSCKHLVGEAIKRIVIWIVGLLTLAGNGMVLLYTLVWNTKTFKKTYGVFITGLAIADFIMVFYLIIIAGADIYFEDKYVLKEDEWKNGLFCSFSGFLSALSSEVSTFFICLITLDRYLGIAYPFGEHKLSKPLAWSSFALSWIAGFIVALTPVFVTDWEIYSNSGLCLALPFSSNLNNGWEFLFIVFVGINFCLFVSIALGQVSIFSSIIKRRKQMPCLKYNSTRRLEDLSVARKLAFVAITDFCCWFPIGIIGLLSLQGYVIDREVYAWIAVFVLPVNSALNPVIYTVPVIYSTWKRKHISNIISLGTQSE